MADTTAKENTIPSSGAGGTGLLTMFETLVDCLCDKDGTVRSTAATSLVVLGKQHPSMALNLYMDHLQNNKLIPAQRTAVLEAASVTCGHAIDTDAQISCECLDRLINVSSAEIVCAPIVVADKSAASDILINLSKKHCDKVMACLMETTEPPHVYWINTLAGIATVNVFEFVLYLKAIISVSLTTIGSLKTDLLKLAYANALCRFSEAILEYVENLEKAPDKTVQKEMFSMEYDWLYDTLVQSWLQTKDSRLRGAVLEAIGYTTHLMSAEKVEQQITKLIPVLLSLYRRHPEPYQITRSLSQALKASSGKNITNLDSLLNCLFQQGCITPDYSQPGSVKHHHEVLRCFDILGFHTDIAGNKSEQGLSVVSYLLEKLESSSQEARVGALTILRHLVNSRTVNCLRGREKIVLNSLQMLLHDKDVKVKSGLAQMIVAMAHHGYLNSEGGYIFIEFILKQCTLIEDTSRRNYDTSDREALRLMCGNILHLLATTVECAQPLLWPKMLRHLMQEEYVTAVAVLVKALAPLAQKHTENPYNLENKVMLTSGEGLPLPVSLVSRCIVLLVHNPLEGEKGLDLLKLMSALAPFLNKALVPIWEAKIAHLKKIIEDSEGEIKENWEEEVLELLSVTLKTPGTEEWLLGIGGALSAQIALYGKSSVERAFLFRCLGMVAQHVTAVEHVHPVLDSILTTIRHAEKIEREGAAAGIGICAVTHLDLVLIKLEALSKTAAGQPSRGFSSFLAFMKQDSRSEADLCRIRALVLLCYGEVFMRCPFRLLSKKLESMLISLMPTLHSAQTPDGGNIIGQWKGVSTEKDGIIREASLLCMLKLATAVLRDGGSEAIMSYRDDFIALCQIHIRASGPDTASVRLLAAKTALYMIRLQPSLKPGVRVQFMKDLFESVSEVCTEVEELSEENLELIKYMNDIAKEVLKGSMVPSTVDEIFSILLPGLSFNLVRIRMVAIECLENILTSYLADMSFSIGTPTSFSPLPMIAGHLLGRCTDSSEAVSEHAINSLKCLLQIGLRYEGYSQEYGEESLQSLKEIQQTPAETRVSHISCKVAQVVIERLPTDQLPHLLESLYICLKNDYHPTSSEGCALMLLAILKDRGQELHQSVDSILENLYEKLCEVKHERTKELMLEAVRRIAEHHLNKVITALLNFPLPYDENLSHMWTILAKSADAPAVLDLLIDLLLRERPYEDHKDRRLPNSVVRIAMIRPLTAICALTEMFSASELKQAAQKEFPRLFSSLLLVQSCYVGVCSPIASPQGGEKASAQHKFYPNRDAYKINPLWSTSECVMALLKLCDCNSMSVAMHSLPVSHWMQVEDLSLYANGLSPLVGAFPMDMCSLIDQLVECFTPSLNSIYIAHRITAVTVLGELINGPIEGSLDTVVTALLSRYLDDCITVRKLSHRGLSHLAQKACFPKYATKVLGCFLAGIDDQDDTNGEVTLEAFYALTACLPMSPCTVHALHLTNIAIRIKPYFEKSQRELRAASVELLGVLSALANNCSGEFESVKESMVEQGHSNLICLLMHLSDPEPMVIKASRISLPKVCSLLKCNRVSNLLNEHGSQLFSSYVDELAKALIADIPEKVNLYLEQTVSYFLSQWTSIQGAAALLCGSISGHLEVEDFPDVCIEPVCLALSQLLKTNDCSEVRVCAATAMGRLSRF